MSLRQAFIEKVAYPLDRWRSGDHDELRYFRDYERTQFATPEQLAEIQLQKLKTIIAIAYEWCPYYQQQFRQAGVHPSDLRRLEDLRAFPILEKRNIQRSRDEMVARNCPNSELVPNLTGGSTGTPLSFYVTRDRLRSRSAATWRHNRWAGWNIGDRVVSLWGAPRDAPVPTWKSRARNALIDRTILFNTAQITEQGLRDLDRELKRFRPKVILAYAKSIALCASFFRSQGIEAYRPESIVVSAEVLETSERKLIESVFGCQVFNRYGCREVSVIASECDRHDGLHLMAEGLFVEVADGQMAAQAGKVGEVFVTDLMNVGMPLIRYRIGDMASVDTDACACGRGLPRLKQIAGRVTDFLVTGDGRLVSGAALTVAVVARRPSLGQVQIVQEERGRVLFRIARGSGLTPSTDDLQYLAEESKHYLGTDVQIEFEAVESIPSLPSGKHSFCKSTATCDFLDLVATRMEETTSIRNEARSQ